MLIAQGESPKYVCDQMGHSSIQVTFDIYGHLFPQGRREAADKYQQAMLKGKIKANGSSLVAGKNISDRLRLIDGSGKWLEMIDWEEVTGRRELVAGEGFEPSTFGL